MTGCTIYNGKALPRSETEIQDILPHGAAEEAVPEKSAAERLIEGLAGVTTLAQIRAVAKEILESTEGLA